MAGSDWKFPSAVPRLIKRVSSLSEEDDVDQKSKISFREWKLSRQLRKNIESLLPSYKVDQSDAAGLLPKCSSSTSLTRSQSTTSGFVSPKIDEERDWTTMPPIIKASLSRSDVILDIEDIFSSSDEIERDRQTTTSSEDDDDFDSNNFLDIKRKLTLQRFFSDWKKVALEERSSRELRAQVYRVFKLKEKVFKNWRKLAKKEKERKLQLKETQQKNKIAQKFYENKLLIGVFFAWSRYCQFQGAKSRLNRSNRRRIRAKESVDNFIKHLEDAKRAWHKELHNHGVKKKSVPVSDVWQKNKVPADDEVKRDFNYRWGLDEFESSKIPILINRKTQSANLNLEVSQSKAKQGQAKARLPMAMTRSATSLMTGKELREMKSRIREQERELLEMEKIKDQLKQGRCVTNQNLYRSLIAPDAPKALIEIKHRDMVDLGLRKRELISFRSPVSPTKEIRNIVVSQGESEESNDTRNKQDEEEEEEEEEEESRFLLPIDNKKDRKLERERKREDLRTFHRMKAEERKKQKLEIEAKKEREEKEEKARKREEVKAWRKRQRSRQIERERRFHLTLKADQFYNIYLLRSFGFRPWLKLMADVRLKMFLAEKKLRETTLKKAFHFWLHMTRSSEVMRRLKAERFWRNRLMTKGLRRWVQNWRESRSKLQAADDFSELRLTQSAFRKWKRLLVERKLKEEIASEQYRRNIMRKLLDRWRTNTNERISSFLMRSRTRKRLSRRISQMLPDYHRGPGNTIDGEVNDDDIDELKLPPTFGLIPSSSTSSSCASSSLIPKRLIPEFVSDSFTSEE